ncbi:THO complex subunit 4 isoform X2 [Wyeomyia smithii]|uniref:THO complex subunit 4 isoform X2 n=1 Tax=Wyeomyia smithii TaxID=174621 RepID=UPI0024680E5B|nr:THO complex subunit 4 isoform X2 [Wyeomyia smithii]
MVDKIEMSLDDIIKSQRPQRGGNRGGVYRSGGGAPRSRPRNGTSGGGGFRSNRGPVGGGGVLKGRNRGGIQRSSKYARGDVNSAWKHDMYEGARKSRLLAAAGLGLGGASGLGSSKLMVSNLDFGVSESDINELFADFGPLKSASVHYDRSGRSLGTADVVFERRADAIKAMKQYNGVPLDGRPMSIQLATSDIPTPRAPRLGGERSLPRSPRRQSSSGPSRGSQSSRRGGGGGSGGSRRQQRETKTAEELDAELDAYTKDMK